MTKNIRNALRRFGRKEDGSVYVIEWALVFPVLFLVLLSSWELGLYSFRQNFLDRGMDLAVRDIRLNTGTKYTHSQVKQMICEDAGFLNDCLQNLKLEMKTVDPRAFVAFAGSVDCVDRSQPLLPSREFVHGNDHDLMVLRACYLYDPVFPHIGMGKAMTDDGARDGYPIVAVSVFVQEPNT
ncbi:MAG: TadE family protein [Pseudomonadota bacterium]